MELNANIGSSGSRNGTDSAIFFCLLRITIFFTFLFFQRILTFKLC